MEQSLIKAMNYQPQEYLEVHLNQPIDDQQHIFFLSNPYLLNCFVHLSSPSLLYFDTQSYVSLHYYVSHHAIQKTEIKEWCLAFIEQFELDVEGVCITQLNYIFIDEQTKKLKFCKIPLSQPADLNQSLIQFVIDLYECMNYEGDEEWISQLYLLVKQRPFRLGLFKQFLTSKKTKRWLSFFRKDDEELSNFFKMIQVQESQASYGIQTVPFETQVLMAGYQYGYLINERQQKILITSATWKIGRQKDCDYVLDYPEISKLHCQLIVENGTCFIVDLGSTNGTKLNEEHLEPNEKYPLKDLDQLKLAGHSFTYYA